MSRFHFNSNLSFTFYFLIFISIISKTVANEKNHKYEDGEKVILWANTIGPYDNRQETYDFDSLPFCLSQKDDIEHRETLGEALLGYDYKNTGLNIKFKTNKENEIICNKVLNYKEIESFIFAIKNKYWFEMYMDDLPVHGLVGDIRENEFYLYTHYEILVKYNDNRIIQIDLDSNKRKPIKLDNPLKEDSKKENPSPNVNKDIEFTYSIKWEKTDISFRDRFDRYLDSSELEIKIHILAVINSFIIAFLLIAIVTTILYKTLKTDSKPTDDIELGLLEFETDFGDDYGWKLVHGDVFRRPPHCAILSTLLGSGIQLIILLFIIIIYTMLRDLYLEQATILSSTIFIYAITSMIGGYYSGSFFAKYGGRSWIKNMFLTSLLFPCIIGGVTLLINFIAMYYQSSRAIPFSSMLTIFAIWLFIIFPLTLFGSIIGRNFAGNPNNPCRVNLIPRPIPKRTFYYHPLVLVLLSGILPFASILIEIFFLYSSFWAYKIYSVYGVMLIMLLILCILTACVSVISTFVLLNAEDHRWQWTSFFSGASTVIYIFLFSIYYFFKKTKMHGLFQVVFYFGNTGIICLLLISILGTIGYTASNWFVRKIYSNIKID
ncbi:transmembrane 9 superfamily member 3 [Neocallimastix lanati (nom. inval.)]|uniref:Transmembrane 9 superfamily member n=1 Tax=Neocallimastix californiae TaxID=1754190 RepID=A0A1Y2CWH2_9FUNG|nr:transmembrane 9 superfamily member 3 [Neocallimastix sp. JGI-2020a]ORY51184.1 transmembrane 9 superfamily member 3 [Neocallimastix californiae]|eukprot:ORY51184.1 transmembrane 9 superfamily member 3 [Neocallimastix californiae]